MRCRRLQGRSIESRGGGWRWVGSFDPVRGVDAGGSDDDDDDDDDDGDGDGDGDGAYGDIYAVRVRMRWRSVPVYA